MECEPSHNKHKFGDRRASVAQVFSEVVMRLTCGFILALSLLLATGCGKKETAGTGGQDSPTPTNAGGSSSSIEGTYLVVGIDFNGEKIPDAELAKESEAERTVVIKGGKFVGKMGGASKEEEFKTDATTTPARIDFTASMPGGKSRVQLGIYKIEGDTLTVAVTNDPQQPPKERPKDFTPNKESFILTLKRTTGGTTLNTTPSAGKKDEPAPATPPVVLTPAQVREGVKQDRSFLVEKYGGQTVEVTGSVNGLSPQKEKDIVGYVALHAGGTSLTNVAVFGIGTQKDLDKVLPGKTVTLRATVPKKGEVQTLVWSVIKVTDE